jgi:hypothetical protein
MPGQIAVVESPEPRDRFGFSLAFAGASLLVGAPGESMPGAPESGAVHVVPLAGSPGSRVLREDVPAPYDHFGWSVSGAAGGRFLVGAPDRGGTGAVTLVGSGIWHELLPGGASPSGKEAFDFGAALAG